MRFIPTIRIKKIAYVLLLQAAILSMAACGATTANSTKEEKLNSGILSVGVGQYDSVDDNAIVTMIDTGDKKLTLYNLERNRKFTLEYDGTTKAYDKFGTDISMNQVNPGQLVNITFLKGRKRLVSLQQSADAWTMESISGFEIDDKSQKINIDGETYRFDESLLTMAEGRPVELISINSVDTVTFTGIDKMIYSVSVEKGHGYLRLKGEDYFVGGWIEVGSKIIKKISKDMLIAVPEGVYDVQIRGDKVKASKSVSIIINHETEMDLSDLVPEDKEEYGNLIIVSNPSDAEFFIDGDLADTSRPVRLLFGVHQIIGRADGYKTLTQYIKVGTENATIEISLEKESSKEKSDDAVISPGISPVPTAAEPTTPVTVDTESDSKKAKVHILSPEEVEVYLDGKYIGIAPVSFDKVAGNHEITLRKEGYTTRSYTITLDKNDSDENYNFSPLMKSYE